MNIDEVEQKIEARTGKMECRVRVYRPEVCSGQAGRSKDAEGSASTRDP
jgi:hypothetical protein